MAEIGEQAGLHAFDHGIRIDPQIFFAVCRPETTVALAGRIFLADPMLAEDKVFESVSPIEGDEIVEHFRIILDLKADMHLDLIRVFFPERPEGIHIIRQKFRTHSHVGLQIIRPDHAAVIRKTEDLNAVRNGGRDIVLVCSQCVVAAEGMCMVVCNHVGGLFARS